MYIQSTEETATGRLSRLAVLEPESVLPQEEIPFSRQWEIHQLNKEKPLSQVAMQIAGSVLPTESVGFGKKRILPVPYSEKPQEVFFFKVASANHLVPVIGNICGV